MEEKSFCPNCGNGTPAENEPDTFAIDVNEINIKLHEYLDLFSPEEKKALTEAIEKNFRKTTDGEGTTIEDYHTKYWAIYQRLLQITTPVFMEWDKENECLPLMVSLFNRNDCKECTNLRQFILKIINTKIMETKQLKTYRFKEDHSFDVDIYNIGQPPAWIAKKGEIVKGLPFTDSEMQFKEGEYWIMLEGEKSGLVELELLEEII